MSPKANHNQDTNRRNTYLRYSGLAFQILAAIFLGIWGGYQLDQWIGLKYPVFTIVFSLAALLGAMVYLVKSLPKN